MIAALTTASESHASIECARADRHAQLELDLATMRTLMSAGLTPREALAVFRRELTTSWSGFRS